MFHHNIGLLVSVAESLDDCLPSLLNVINFQTLPKVTRGHAAPMCEIKNRGHRFNFRAISGFLKIRTKISYSEAVRDIAVKLGEVVVICLPHAP